MTSLLEGAKKLVTRGTDIGARLDGLRPPAGRRLRVGAVHEDDLHVVLAAEDSLRSIQYAEIVVLLLDATPAQIGGFLGGAVFVLLAGGHRHIVNLRRRRRIYFAH